MKLSIITPVMNGEKSIEQTLTSVADQKSGEVEHIVVDGGSTDGTLEIVGRYAQSVDVLISEPDRGISDAINKGIALASGDFIAVLNSDDSYESDALELVLKCIDEQSDVEIFHGDVYLLDVNLQYRFARQSTLRNVHRFMTLYHPALFVQRRLHGKIGGYREDYDLAMDCEFIHRAIAHGASFQHIEASLATMSLGGVSYQRYRKALNEYQRSVREHGLASRLEATFWCARQLVVQSALHLPWVQKLWLRVMRSQTIEKRTG